MRSAWLVALVCVAGCAHDYLTGNDEPEGGSGGATTTTGSEASTGGSSNASAQEGEGTGGGSSSSSSSSGMNATMGSNGPVISAAYIVGGIDRVRIFKFEPTLGLCTIVTVAGFGENMTDVDTPMNWSLETIVITDEPDDCDPPDAPVGQIAMAASSSGFVSWEGTGIPCELDVGIAIEFDAAWAPAEDHVNGSAVPVEGCP